MESIVCVFGEDYRKKEQRIQSYDYIENFISEAHIDWNSSPDTSTITNNFNESLANFSKQDAAFLMVHSGYIPEIYPPDSSQETLYSKLVEAVVLNWALRLGFENSVLPTQKASMEDVSIIDEQYVIVCDTKAFRLGRSQSAPNVKDVLKHADIEKWLSAHDEKERLGGLVTFPSQHDWKSGSDFYQYTTDKSSPTATFYYQHLAFFLIADFTSHNLIEMYANYADIFPDKILKSEGNRDKYFEAIENFLFRDNQENWIEFQDTAEKIIREKAFHCSTTLYRQIEYIRGGIENTYDEINDVDLLRKKAIDAEFSKATENLKKQADRIGRFRISADRYYEE